MDEFHEKAIEKEWPVDIDKMSAKERRALVKKLVKTATELRTQRKAQRRDERINDAVMFATLTYDAVTSKDSRTFVEPPGGSNNRPGEKLIKGKTKGMKKRRGAGISL